MKRIGRFILIVFSLMTMFSTYISAQDNKFTPKESVVERAYNACPSSLDSEIPGIVESTIYNIVCIKKFYPQANYSDIISKLNDISEKNSDPSIRFKAHLATIYLSLGDMIDVKPEVGKFEHEYIFKQITEQLENKLLVVKD